MICWIIIALGAASITVQLRYLTLLQNNNYHLPQSKPLIKYYLFSSLLFVPTFALGILYLFLSKNIVMLINGIFVTVAFLIILIKNILFRTKFKFTQRGTIYFIFCTIIPFFVIVIIAHFFIKPTYFVLIQYLQIIASPLIIALMSLVTSLYYNYKNNKFIAEQKVKLEAINPIVVGITGSYGKTSCKNILEFFIKDEFLTIASEKNYNTPMGLALTINKMKGDEQIFIAEMGARRMGDIEELCHFVKPKYAIISGVCEQHLETFGDIDQIYNEKFTLARALPVDGVCVFNANDKYVLRMSKNFGGRKLSASSYKEGDVFADGIALGMDGTTFSLHINNSVYECKTQLLGRHNVQNIVMCAAMAYILGVKPEKIVNKIRKLQQIPHRLEYTYANGVHIIDDGYNANIQGVKSALEVLNKFPHRRIVVSQGIVELGHSGAIINAVIGVELTKVADVVILCGTNAKYIANGLKSGNFVGQIIFAKNMKMVQKIIKNIVMSGDTVLLQNDVPDIY